MHLCFSFEAIKRRRRAHWRSRRMQAFLDLLHPLSGATVLDLGGSPELWELCGHPLDVTLLNTDAAKAWGFRSPRPDRFRIVKGDACDLARFGDQSFDIVFSNSVIEHLGDDERVRCFAAEVRRVGRSYWVQTPSWCFPVEAHTSVPFFWLYPRGAREAIARRFDRRNAGQAWLCPMAQTRSFRLSELRALFPDASLFTERVAGLTKSWSLYRRRPAS